jgi:transposase InsO family protein
MALRQRRPAPGLVHHSDRGVQYASYEYTDLLQRHGSHISMSRKGNPSDNAACESFIKTLKYEEVYRSEYRDLADAYESEPGGARNTRDRVWCDHGSHDLLFGGQEPCGPELIWARLG